MKQRNCANGLVTDHSVILEHLLSLKNVVILGYQQVDEHASRKHVTKIITICAKRSSPPELQSLAHTLTQWQEEILAYINHHYSNGITEGMNNHIKKIKRNGYGYRNFNNYRLRILLALGGVHTNILKTILIP